LCIRSLSVPVKFKPITGCDFTATYIAQIIMCFTKKCLPDFILWRLQYIVEKNIYGIKIELWAWRVVISLKFDYILVPLPKSCAKTDITA